MDAVIARQFLKCRFYEGVHDTILRGAKSKGHK
jgi:hypothetical protein